MNDQPLIPEEILQRIEAQQIERRAAIVRFVIILVAGVVALALFVPMG